MNKFGATEMRLIHWHNPILTRLPKLLLTVFVMLAIVASTAKAGTVTYLPEKARFIVIGGALGEIVYALDAQDYLIGRDSTATYPDSIRQLPDVGYMRNLSAEGILSLAPQGLLVVEGSGPPETLTLLQKTDLPMVTIKESHSEQGVYDKIAAVGAALHHTNQAQQLVDGIKVDFTKLHDDLTAIEHHKRVLFVMSVQNGRLMAAGQKSAADAMITLSGGVNALQNVQGYRLLNDEALIMAAPDYVLFMQNGRTEMQIDQFMEIAALRATPAGEAQAISGIDGLYFLGFGPRTAQAARDVASRLYPQLQRQD